MTLSIHINTLPFPSLPFNFIFIFIYHLLLNTYG